MLGRDGDHLSTETGLQNVEYALYRLVPEQVLDIGDPKRFRKHPGRKVRYAGIDDFSLVDQVVDGPQRFLDRGFRIERMAVEQVDPVGAQPSQRIFDGAHDVIAGRPDVVYPGTHLRAVLGCKDHVVSSAGFCQIVSDHRFRSPLVVRIGRVDKVDPGVKCRAHDLVGRRFVAAPLVTVVVGAQAEVRDLRPGASELYIFDRNFEAPCGVSSRCCLLL